MEPILVGFPSESTLLSSPHVAVKEPLRNSPQTQRLHRIIAKAGRAEIRGSLRNFSTFSNEQPRSKLDLPIFSRKIRMIRGLETLASPSEQKDDRSDGTQENRKEMSRCHRGNAAGWMRIQAMHLAHAEPQHPDDDSRSPGPPGIRGSHGRA